MSKILFVAALLLPAAAWADANADWQLIVALDSGPAGDLTNRETARKLILAHVQKQEALLRKFLTDYPADANAWEARLRLSHTLSLRSDLEEKPALEKKADALLDELATSAGDDPKRGASVAFARLSKLMRRNRAPDAAARDNLRAAAQSFAAKFPTDPRAAAALTEVAGLYDAQPRQEDQLLQQAERLARTDDLRARIGDDRKRLALLGQPLDLSWTAADGTAQSVAGFRGRPVVITFFAAWSPPSLAALADVAALPAKQRAQVALVAISLDEQIAAAQKILAAYPGDWSLGCDGRGWESPALRQLGINALPLVWVLDRAGRLRALNAAPDVAGTVAQVLAEKK